MERDLVWSDGLLDEAQGTRDEVAATLVELGVPGELVLTGATSIPGALTKGDVDLHLRVEPAGFQEVVDRLSRVFNVGSPSSWAATLAVFDVPRPRATGLAVTPVGSEHDLRFRSTWRALHLDQRGGRLTRRGRESTGLALGWRMRTVSIRVSPGGSTP